MFVFCAGLAGANSRAAIRAWFNVIYPWRTISCNIIRARAIFLSGFASGLYVVGAFNIAAICAAWAIDRLFADV